MSQHILHAGKAEGVMDVHFLEVNFAAPRGTRIVIELEGGLRLLVANDGAVDLASRAIAALRDARSRKRGCR